MTLRLAARRGSPPGRRRAASPQPDAAGEAALVLQFARLGWEVANRRLSEADAHAMLRMATRLLDGRPSAKVLVACAKFISAAGLAAAMR